MSLLEEHCRSDSNPDGIIVGDIEETLKRSDGSFGWGRIKRRIENIEMATME